MAKITGHSGKSKHAIQYTNVLSAMRSVHHDINLPPPEPPTAWTVNRTYEKSGDEDCDEEIDLADPRLKLHPSSEEPHMIIQVELNDLVRDYNLSKNNLKSMALD